jgi:prophage DNA circulation protein
MATKKKLSDNLRPASFRGVPFQVESTDLGAGRRTQLHEYPQRDKPYVEDLGRATRDLAFSGFVVGEDYVDQANKLLGALEQAGPGTLVHPWFGTLQVSLKEPARVSFDAGLGQARFSMSFVEAGELEFPTAASSTQAASRNAASALETASVKSFADRFSVKGFQDFVSAAANGNLGDMLGIVSSSEIGKVLGLANSLASTVSTAIALVSNPSSLGWKILGALGLSGLATTVAAWSSIVRSLSRVGSSSSLSDPAPPSVYTPSRQQAYINASAINALARQALIAQAVGASSLVGTKIDSKPISYNDMIAVRDDLIATIDKESLTATDSVYEALQVARLAVWQDLTVRARDNARLTTLTPPEVLPALAIAYDYYEDAAREADIVARNGVRHPGFVPAEPMKVLTR